MDNQSFDWLLHGCHVLSEMAVENECGTAEHLRSTSQLIEDTIS